MFLYLFIGALTLFYFYVKKKFQYFANLGIKHQPGTFPFGSDCSWKMVMGKINFVEMQNEVGKEFPNEKVVGYYGMFGSPTFVVNDFDLAKKIMIKDFDHFTDRRAMKFGGEENKYMDKMLTSLEGDEWRVVRQMMVPLFTSNKLKHMLPTVYQASDDFIKYLDQKEDKTNIDIKDLMQLCTCEILAEAGCGVKPNILENPENSIFYSHLKTLLGQNMSTFAMIKLMIFFTVPGILKIFKLSLLDSETQKFFVGIIKESIKIRKESKVKMNDFVDHLIEMGQNLDKLRVTKEDLESDFEKDALMNKTETLRKMSEQELEDLIVATALLLVFGGNDTTTSALALTFFFLAQQQDLQEKLYQEVNDAIVENGGSQNLDYNSLHKLKFMEKFVKESIRSWNIGLVERLCTKDYFIEDLKLTIPKGALVQILESKETYENPSSFDPELHFESDTLIPGNFYGFGQGPRNCIGMRFAWTMIRSLLVKVLANYKVLPTENFPKEFVIDPRGTTGMPKDGVRVKLEKRA